MLLIGEAQGDTSEDTRLRLLLVEDSEDDAELVCIELTRAGYTCEPMRVETAEAFGAALREREWDLIISDFQMPAFDGLTAFRMFQELDIDIPFLFVSGFLGEERAVQAMRAGARDYILKGDLRRLATTVRRELDAGRDRRRRTELERTSILERRRLELAVEVTGSGFFEHGTSSSEVHISPRCAEILGYAGDARLGIGLDWVERHVDPDDWDALRGIYERFLCGAITLVDFEFRGRNRLGELCHLAIHAKATERDADGLARHVVGVLRDVGERRALEEQLRAAQKMESIGRLAGGVAHDLNNILTVIYTFCGFVQEDLPEEDPAREDLGQVLLAATKASRLTSQLLAFSRQKPVSPRVVQINAVLSDVSRMLERVMGEHIAQERDLSGSVGNVRLDPDAFEQVVLNMAINAKDAMPDGGTFRIASSQVRLDAKGSISIPDELPPGEYVSVALSDSGTGMDAATQARIFEPFYTTKGPTRGTGLGLAMCYGIIKQAGGHIVVRSAPGAGTTFEIFLPCVRDEAQLEVQRPTPTSIEGNETVLLVEDDAQLRESTARSLQGLGYDVTTASNGREALAIAGQEPTRFDLLITDMIMPEMGGIRLVEEWRRRHPGGRILMMSGYAEEEGDGRGVAAACALIEKPFTRRTFAERVRQVLDE